MRILFGNFCAKRIETKPKVNLETSNVSKKKNSDPNLWRDILAYWILGLGTEFGYVVMISAASDILHGFHDSAQHPSESSTSSINDDPSKIRQSVCDTPSTGVLLIADIIPSMTMNIFMPFLPLFKNFRMLLVIALNVASFLLIASTQVDYLAIVGVVFTSLALGIGEVTLLSYSAQFDKKVITAWSSGTGSAGIIGSLCWAGLISLGMTPPNVLRCMLVVPAIQAATFWFLLRKPSKKVAEFNVRPVDISTIESNNCIPDCTDCGMPPFDVQLNDVKAKLRFMPKLWNFIVPLLIVFLFEYICVSGLFEMIYMKELPFGITMRPDSQYRWFLVTYQIGVFTSRTLGGFLKPRRTWWATFVQFINFCYFLYIGSTPDTPSSWTVFIFVFELGIIGGLCFVHTFHRLVKELPSNQHKFSLGMITIAESIGIAIGGSIAIIIHNILCGKSLATK